MLRDGSCSEHGPQRGEEDLRLRFVVDNGISNANLFLGKDAAESFLGMSMEEVKQEISVTSNQDFISDSRALSWPRKSVFKEDVQSMDKELCFLQSELIFWKLILPKLLLR